MNWADYAILGVLAISCLISLKRGFVKEALSMANWVLAFIVAVTFRDSFAVLLEAHIPTPSLREMAAFAGLFAATLIVGAMVNHLIGELVKMTGLSGTDRFLGVLFGAIRGLVVVMAVLLLVPSVVPIDQDPWWKQSVLIPQFLSFESWTRNLASELMSFASNFYQ